MVWLLNINKVSYHDTLTVALELQEMPRVREPLHFSKLPTGGSAELLRQIPFTVRLKADKLHVVCTMYIIFSVT